jgi:AcrR family transcriptional regulator
MAIDTNRAINGPVTGEVTNNPSYDAIVDAARELFIAVGFPNTSMDMIARRATVVRATIYNNFRDKDAVLAAILNRYQQGYATIPDRLRSQATPDHSSFELIEATIREAFEWRHANANLRPLIDLAKALPNNEWNIANDAADDAMRRWLLGIHRSDARRGMLRDGIRLRSATAALWGMIDAALSSSDVHASRATVRTTVRQLALLHWYAIYRVEPDWQPH